MSTKDSIKFSFHRITTDQFAIIEGTYKIDKPADVYSDFGFGAAIHEKILAIQGSFRYEQDTKVFMLATVTCQYKIHADNWAHMFNEAEMKFKVPKQPALHLASLVVSLARGVIHTKTENHPLHVMILPPVNIHEIITSDLEISLAEMVL